MQPAKRPLFVLLACLFVVMIGFGLTLPVLAFYVERLALAAGASRQAIVVHVMLLTSIYALMQLCFAPLWGRLSDRIGRRPLILIGIAGYVVAQTMFGLSASLQLLYAARIVGGILSSATLPASAAYVADMTTARDRSRGMAWLGTAASLGVVVGPALGGLLSESDWHVTWSVGHIRLDGFSVPFFAAALLGLLTLLAALRWLPESHPVRPLMSGIPERAANSDTRLNRPPLLPALLPLLALTLGAQIAIALFEGTFSLFSQAKFGFRPIDVGYAFMVCGLVMAVVQVGAVGLLADRIREPIQIGAGFTLMGLGMSMLAIVERRWLVFVFIGLFSLGLAIVAPNLAAGVSRSGGDRETGAALGLQNAANSLGQSVGPLAGGALLVWQPGAPYLLTGLFVMTLGLIAWMAGDA